MKVDRGNLASRSYRANFLREQSGAITVDWIILAAVVTGLGISSAIAVQTGSNQLASSIQNVLVGANVTETGELGSNRETLELTTLADGRIQTDVYVDGVLVQSEITDPNNAHAWNNWVTYYDEDGNRTAEIVTYNDGRISEASFVNNTLVSRNWQDVDDTNYWSSISDSFHDNGRQISREIVNDDNTSLTEQWANGRLSERTYRNAEGEVTVTGLYSYVLDNLNQVQSRNIAYSDGRHSVTSYNGNVPARQTITDNQNAHWWSDQVHTYDSLGRTADIVVTYNDGRQYQDIYTAGVRTQRIDRDAEGNITAITDF